MNRFLIVLTLAGLASVGCATVDERVDGKGRVQRVASMTSLFPSDATAYAQVGAFADGTRALTTSGNGGFASHCQPDGTCTQVSVLPNWAGGGFANGGGGPAYAESYFRNGVTDAPPIQGNTTGPTDAQLAGTVDALGRRVEGVEKRVEGIDGDVEVLLDAHRVDQK